ncbi:hypothetical protein V2J09_004624, partial [Rumex salicifolius]
ESYYLEFFRSRKNVDVYTAKGLLSTGYKYLDVRTKEEYEQSHVEDALNIPYLFKTEEGKVLNPEFLAQVSEVCKKDDHLIVACNAGGRGLRASVDLLNAGFEDVQNMEGGYAAWVKAGLSGEEAKDLKIACKFRSLGCNQT